MDSSPTPAARAQAYWQEAKKIRHRIIRDIEQLKKGPSSKTEEEQLKILEENMAQYVRLLLQKSARDVTRIQEEDERTVQTIHALLKALRFRLRFVCTLAEDPKYIYQLDAEEVMWQLHIYINKAYRDLFNERLRGQPHVVTKRKVEKLYIHYLKTAHDFYKIYFQRLQALHGMPQIPRINSVLKLQAPEVEERQSPIIPAEAVQKSFHSTLLHLGDLSRWRHKARPKPDGSKMALLYYDLAHDLKPTSGDAHHQMGMIYTEEHNHLLVVYHLYRSLAIELPHGNSIRNLEIEFKQILQSSTPSRRAGPPDPNEAFSNWFVRLHAHFYKGEPFSQQSELEETVLHRLETMLKKPDTLPLILKMVLINIAAYYVARSRVDKKWSLGASNSCQFILGMNVRWIVALSRVLQSELQEYSKAAAPAKDNVDNNDGETSKTPRKFSAFVENILPLMRIYLAWLYIYRADIVKYQDHLGGHVFDMYRALAQTLTTITQEFKGQQMAASPYLLPEDVVALGTKPFDEPSMASVCRLHLAFDKDAFKPHWEDMGLSRNGPDVEMKARVYDLMNCGFSLALDERFPLAANPPAKGSDGVITIAYVEGGKVAQIVPDEITTSQPLPPDDQVDQIKGNIWNLRPASSADVAGHTIGQNVDNLSGEHATAKSGSIANVGSPELPTNSIDTLETESDLNLDAQMHNMVDDLLEDDGLDMMGACPRRKTTDQPNTSSCGMHSATAEQVFGGLQTPGPGPGLVFGTASPWGAFVSPPQTGATRGEPTPQHSERSQFSTGFPIHAQRASSTSSLQPDVPVFTPGAGLQLGLEASTLFPVSNAKAPGSQFGQAGFGFYGRPSSGLSGALQGSRGSVGHTRQRLGGSTGSSGASSFFSPKDNGGAYEIASGIQVTGQFANNARAKAVSSPLGFSLGRNPFSTDYLQPTPGISTANSPFGLPPGQLNGVFAHGDIYAHNQNFADTLPDYMQRNDLTTVCNGNLYDATNTYGRGAVSAKDNPSHFRNAVKKTHMAQAVAEADAFDRAILESALAEDHSRPKG